MKIDEEIIKAMENEIEKLFQSMLINKEDLDRLQKLMSIYASLTAIRLNRAQIEMVKSSREFMKNVDISKIDFNGMLKTMKGEG